MKYKMIIVMAVCAASMQAMEKKFWSITVGTTKINLTKGFIGSAGNRVDVIVLGRNEQITLQPPKFGRMQHVGEYAACDEHVIYRKSRDDDSGSGDDEYKPYQYAGCYSWIDEKYKIWNRRTETIVAAELVTIMEPRITMGFSGHDLSYYAQRKNPEKEDSYIVCDVADKEAIKEASQDLITCYYTVLSKAEAKKIALPALSTEVGFPRKKAAPVAVKAIITFIKTNPDAYSVVELFVKKRSEFDLYKKYLEHYAAEITC